MRPEILVRPAVLADLDAVMAIERRPEYDEYVGRSDRSEHEAMFASPTWRYLVGIDDAGEILAFAILSVTDDPHGNVYLKRVAAARPGEGIGTAFMEALLHYAFAEPRAHRFHLSCFAHNSRAQALYAKFGLTRDGVLRQAYLAPEGRRYDLTLMATIRPEWEARRRGALSG